MKHLPEIAFMQTLGRLALILLSIAVAFPAGGATLPAVQPEETGFACSLLQREYPFVGVAFDIKSDKPLISTVTVDSPAMSAGIKPGDVVVACNDNRVANYNEVIAAIGKLKVGDVLKLTLERAAMLQNFQVTIASKPVGYTYMDCALSDTESPDVAEKIHWLTKAADLGYVNAMMILGELYSNKEPRNYEEAIKWFTRAATQGEAEAQLLLGMYYYYGDDVKKNRAEAAKWFRLAAEQGAADAQITLGLMYSTGDGVEKNHLEAVKWLQQASDRGLPKAKCALGVMYNYGLGVPQDSAKAFRLFEEAAAKGDANAKYHLALFYVQGTVVGKDQKKASELLADAEKQGSLEARALRESLYR